MSDLKISDRQRDLAKFANAAGQPQQPIPGGHALVRPTTGLADRIIGAQQVAVYRDEGKILQKLTQIAAAAGTDWFYRYPVKTKEGGQSWIEGPSIKLANDVARIFGNNVNEIREIDNGDSWTFYARFTDIETGFSMERAYRQRKSQTSMKTKDADRQLDIAYSIGQSKAIRNCIVNSLQIYADYAFEHARNSLVEKIGKDLSGYRTRVLEGLARIPVVLNRVERVVGRASKDWLAPDLAQIIAMMKSIADGMATADEVFPPIEQVQPPAPDPESGAAQSEPAVSANEAQIAPLAADPEPTVGDLISKAQQHPPKNVETFKLLMTQIIAAAKPEDAAALEMWWAGPNARTMRNRAGMTAADTAEMAKEVQAAIAALGREPS